MQGIQTLVLNAKVDSGPIDTTTTLNMSHLLSYDGDWCGGGAVAITGGNGSGLFPQPSFDFEASIQVRRGTTVSLGEWQVTVV